MPSQPVYDLYWKNGTGIGISQSTSVVPVSTISPIVHTHTSFIYHRLCSVVGITTHHELDGPGFGPRWGRDFPEAFRPALRPIQPPVEFVPGLFPGCKAAGA